MSDTEVNVNELAEGPYEESKRGALPAHLRRIASRDYCGVNEGFWAMFDAAAEITRLRARVAELEASLAEATGDRDALLKAIGFLPGALGDGDIRDIVLLDASGLRPAMVKARREAQDLLSDAQLWHAFADEQPRLLLMVWKQRRAAERERDEARSKCERLRTALTHGLGIIVEFGDLNGFRNLSDEELGRAVNAVAKEMAAALTDQATSQPKEPT